MNFTCTPEKKKNKRGDWRDHTPRWWEHEVQSVFRDTRPPLPLTEVMRVGVSSGKVQAAYWYSELDGPASVEMLFAAVSVDLRGKGGGYADEMFEDAIDTMTERAMAAGEDFIDVSGSIHESNHPSQALCRRFGFRHTGMLKPGTQRWSAVIFAPDLVPEIDVEPPMS